MTAKKVIRAQNIAIENHIPTLYLVDSAGLFLPLQEDVFPDTDDFGRVFRNNAVMSAMAKPLTENEIRELASYFSRQQGLATKR